MSVQRLSAVKIVVFDFDGVFTDNKVILNQDGIESVRCSRFDGFGIRLLKDLGLHYYILSTEKNDVVLQRAKKLGIECFHGVDNKPAAIKEILTKHQCEAEQLAYIGNDVNDIIPIRVAGLGVAVKDSHPEVLKAADHILDSKGGDGAVREFCELIYKVQRNQDQVWTEDVLDRLVYYRSK
jgi:YrbI family 3-deoxy-D-manno-octulosonate 8-phosphate phosphatase